MPSVFLWGLAQFGIPRPPANGDGPLFFLNPFVCQAVFFVGMYFGCCYQAGSVLTKRLYHSKAIVALCALSGGIFLVLRLIVAFSPRLDPWLLRLAEPLNIQTQGLLRLLNFAVWAYLIWRFHEKLQSAFRNNPLAAWLAFIGQHSLQVFAWTVLFASSCSILMPPHVSRYIGRIETLLSPATLVIPAWIHLRYRQMRRRRAEASLKSLRASAPGKDDRGIRSWIQFRARSALNRFIVPA